MRPKALLFDLDETLILDLPVSRWALQGASYRAAEGRALDPLRLAKEAEAQARRLWRAHPLAAHSERIGHSALEGLWAPYGSGEEAYARHAASYREAVWTEALKAQDLRDLGLASELAHEFAQLRRRYPLYPETLEVLRGLDLPLGLVTNGVASLQRTKLEGSGLAPYFQVVIISGALGLGKPHPEPFLQAARALGVEASACLMVGDRPERDIAGAHAAGMRAVWVDRGFPAEAPLGVPRMTSLRELYSVLNS